MKKFTLMLVFVLVSVIGINAQVVLPYYQGFSSLASGDMATDATSSATAVSTMPEGIASVTSAFQAGGVMRIGTGSTVGSFTSQPIDAGGGSRIKVKFNAVPCPGATLQPAKITFTYGAQTQTVTLSAPTHSWAILQADLLPYSVEFNAEATPTAIVVTTVAEAGHESSIFFDNMKIILSPLGLPLTEGFESTTFPPLGWKAIHVSGPQSWERTTDNGMFHGGEAAARMRYGASDATTENWLISPLLLPAVGQNLLYWRRGRWGVDAGTTVEFRVSTTTDDIAAFTTILKTYTTGAGTTLLDEWKKDTIDLSSYVGQQIYIAIKVVDNFGGSFMIDDIEGPNTSSSDCPAPYDILLSSVTENRADIEWTGDITAAAFIVEYSTTPTFDSNVVSDTINGSYNVSLTGLTPNTRYYVRIKSDCHAGEYSSWAVLNSFRTLCVPIITHTLTENFTSGEINPATNLPYCWARVVGDNDSPAFINTLGHGDRKSVRMVAEDSVSAGNMLATPLFVDSLNGLQVTYWVGRVDTSAHSKFEVGVMSDVTDPNTFVSIKETTPQISVWTPYIVKLNNAPATHRYIAFRMKATGTERAVYYLDDIKVDSIQNCSTPIDLAVSNTSTDTAKLVFVPQGTETEWQYVFTDNMNLTDISTLTPVDITNDTVIIRGLVAGTQYKIWVRAKCSATEFSSWSLAPEYFQTTCVPVRLGWSDTFDSFDSNGVPTCWTRGRSFVSSNGTTFPVAVSIGRLDSAGMAFLVLSDSYFKDSIQIATPQVAVPLNSQVEMSFYLRRVPSRTNENTSLKIGVMSDLNDPSTFILLKSITTFDTLWKKENVIFNDNIPATHNYIVFRALTSSYTGHISIIDDISIHAAPTCIEPTNLRQNLATSASAEVAFDPASASQTAWQYVITENLTLTDPSTLTPVDITNNTFTISGLNVNTRYIVWIRAKCSATDISTWSNPFIIKTDCNPTAIPLAENFEAYNAAESLIPDCWNKISTATTGYPMVVAPSSTDGVISKAIKFSDSQPQYLVMPKLDVPLSGVMLQFKLNQEGASSGKIQVGYMSNPTDASTFVAVETLDNMVYKQLVEKTVLFSSVPDNNGVNRYIAFRYGKIADEAMYTYYYYWIDDVNVTVAPTCMPPTGLSATIVTATEATITFTPGGTETSWALEYKPNNAATWIQGGTITSTTYQITGLTPATKYQFRVKAICSATEESPFSNMAIFKTECAVLTLPAIEEFTTQNFCWKQYSGLASDIFSGTVVMTAVTEGWVYTTTSNNAMSAPKMVVNIFGMSKKHWLVTPEITLSGTNKKLEFKVAYTKYNNDIPADRTGTDDKFIVAIGTVDATGTTTWSATNTTVWNNDGTGNFVLQDIPNTPQNISIDLSAYSGNIRIGFYAESTQSNSDNDLHLDSIVVKEFVSIAPTVTTLPATDISNTTATLNKNVVAGNASITEEGFYYKAVSAPDWIMTQVDAITGLTPNTEYEFYAYAMAGTTIFHGATLNFTTTGNVGLDITEQNIKLYPNPAKDVIRLMVEGLSSKADVSLIDMQGKVVGRYAIAKGGNSISIDVSSFAEGSYIVKVTSDNFNRTERLIIKK